jgi:hypothetical protein
MALQNEVARFGKDGYGCDKYAVLQNINGITLVTFNPHNGYPSDSIGFTYEDAETLIQILKDKLPKK